jgi:progressive ankylosis protein
MNSNTKTEELTNFKIFKFWLPLAATWLMMSMEGPFIAAIIARLPEPKFNLAAFGVAFSFALVIEAPVIMIMSASTALVKDCFSFKKLRNFTYIINGVITALMVVFLIPSIFDYITIDLISLPKKVSDLTYIACIILLPWPGTIGYRRFYQGIMIRYNYTRRVAYGTVIRLVMMSATALILYVFYKFDGVIVGASALTVGVTCEAIASKLMSIKILKSIKEKDLSETKISYKEIITFYYPLALTSLLGLGVHPFVTFFIGQSRMAIESLAILPVVNSLVFIFRSTGLSFQEVGIALFGERGEGFIPLRNFALKLAVISTGLLMIISFTPLAKIWFHDISGLSIELTEFAILPLIIISIMPALSVLISFQRSILVANKNTSPITPATAIEVIGILLVLFLLINGFYFVGAVAAMTAFIIGRIGSIIYLIPPFLRISNNIKNKQSNL